MEKISVSEENYKWLLTRVEKFGDTPDDIIGRIKEQFEQTILSKNYIQVKKTEEQVKKLNPADPPDLRHTRILRASMGDKPVARREWNALVQDLHTIGLKRFGSIKELRQFSLARVIEGQKNDDGYKPIPGSNMSIQGMDANSCWRSIYHLAKRLGTPVSITFEWRNKEDAAFPGETATIESE